MFLKDSDGLQLITSSRNRSRAFQVAETISDDLNVRAVVTNARDPETGGIGLGMYLVKEKGDISPDTIEKAIKLWEEFI